MFSLQNYVIVRSFLMLFFAGILLGKSLPDEITPTPEPSTQNNETTDSDTKQVTTPVDLTLSDKSLNVAEQLKENKEDTPVEEIKEAVKERTNEPEKEKVNESVKEATSGASTSAPRTTIEFVSSIPEITNEVAAREVTSTKEDEVEGRSLRGRSKDGPVDYARRLSEIRKYIRLYEDIIRKIDETLDVAAKKLDKGLGDVNNAIKNIAKSNKGTISLQKSIPKKVNADEEQ